MKGLQPQKQKARVLDRYGKLTISDLDRLFDINTKIGGQGSFGKAPACRRAAAMNLTNGRCRTRWTRCGRSVPLMFEPPAIHGSVAHWRGGLVRVEGVLESRYCWTADGWSVGRWVCCSSDIVCVFVHEHELSRKGLEIIIYHGPPRARPARGAAWAGPTKGPSCCSSGRHI